MSPELSCSFCKKSEHEVAKLAAGPGVHICDACVAIAARVMQEADTTRTRVWIRLSRRLHERFAGWRRHSLLQPGA